ncbi:hypothetical protein HZC32_00120 [Candidatus Woesearchaeota archaeon]|nr:hypothetical protein [Candidatus Woesearchaeota archaeon]
MIKLGVVRVMPKSLVLWIVVLVFILGICFSGVQAISYSAPHVKVTLMSQDPDPVEPGQVVTVKFKVENEGAQSSADAIVKIFPKVPFAIYGDATEKNIGKLRAGSTGADAVIVQFKLKVDSQAVQQSAPLDLMVQLGDTGVSYTNKEFSINIQTQDAVLAITSITSEPYPLSPGGMAKVTIMVKNNADSLLKDIKLKLEMSSSSLPLAPYQSSSEKVIPLLQPSYQQTLTFSLIAKPDATSGLYKIPLNLTYNDEKGKSYVKSDVLAVMVGEKPNINAYIKKSTVMQADGTGKITLEVANAGNTDVKYVELALLPSEDYKLVSTHNYFYLGNIDSDDTQSEEVDVYINKKVDKVHIPVQLKYVDATSKAYQQTFDLEMNVYSSSELKRFGLKESSTAWLYILIIVIVGGGFWAYRRVKKNHNGKTRK